MSNYELILQPVSPTNQAPQWVLTDGGHDIASWTMPHRPSLIALLKAIKLWEEYCEHCIDNWYDPLPFKTYFPTTGPELEAKAHDFYEDLYSPASVGDDSF